MKLPWLLCPQKVVVQWCHLVEGILYAHSQSNTRVAQIWLAAILLQLLRQQLPLGQLLARPGQIFQMPVKRGAPVLVTFSRAPHTFPAAMPSIQLTCLWVPAFLCVLCVWCVLAAQRAIVLYSKSDSKTTAVFCSISSKYKVGQKYLEKLKVTLTVKKACSSFVKQMDSVIIANGGPHYIIVCLIFINDLLWNNICLKGLVFDAII